MNKIDLFLMGAKNLWRRKLRTFLTILGVIIGASSIIVMLSLGFGMKIGFEEQMAQWGSLTTIDVYKGWSEIPGKEEIELNDKAVADFRALKNVLAVSPTLETYGTIINGKYIAQMPIKGIDPESMESFGFQIEEGRFFNKTDDLAVIFGGQVKYNFYDPKARVYREPKINLMKDRMILTMNPNYGYSYPGEKKVNYKEYKIKTAGVLAESNDWEMNYGVYMPITEVQKLVKEKEKAEGVKPQPGKPKEPGYNQVRIKVQTVQQTIKDMGHQAYSLNDELESMKKQAGMIQAVLGGIGAVSLVVAAIGITNTMVMSIYERTKEIGVMKVIGASLKDIKNLFLFESALIGIIGGFVGVGFSYLLSFVVNKFSHIFGPMLGLWDATTISVIPIWLAMAALVFSMLIGVLSGYFPARRAMNLSALEAIRTE